MDNIYLAQDSVQQQAVTNTVTELQVA